MGASQVGAGPRVRQVVDTSPVNVAGLRVSWVAINLCARCGDELFEDEFELCDPCAEEEDADER